MAAAAGGNEGLGRMGGTARGEARPRGGKARPRGKRLQPICGYVLLLPQDSKNGGLNPVEVTPPVFYAPILSDKRPRPGELDVQHGIGFRPERAKDFWGRKIPFDILRQDRDKRGLGIGHARKRSILRGIFGIRAGRACGRAAARYGDRRGANSRTALRTALFGRRGRLHRSAFVRQIPNLRTRNRFWRLVTSPRQRLRADIGGIVSNIFAPPPLLCHSIYQARKVVLHIGGVHAV